MKKTNEMLDKLKQLGFNYATKAGFSLGIEDFMIPAEKPEIIKKAEKEVTQVEKAPPGRDNFLRREI